MSSIFVNFSKNNSLANFNLAKMYLVLLLVSFILCTRECVQRSSVRERKENHEPSAFSKVFNFIHSERKQKRRRKHQEIVERTTDSLHQTLQRINDRKEEFEKSKYMAGYAFMFSVINKSDCYLIISGTRLEDNILNRCKSFKTFQNGDIVTVEKVGLIKAKIVANINLKTSKFTFLPVSKSVEFRTKFLFLIEKEAVVAHIGNQNIKMTQKCKIYNNDELFNGDKLGKFRVEKTNEMVLVINSNTGKAILSCGKKVYIHTTEKDFEEENKDGVKFELVPELPEKKKKRWNFI